MTQLAKPELVSFDLCPFVQRSVIALKEKGVDFDVTYIDLENKPDWFLAISPLGKVPLLRVGHEVLFESAVINEYLDEVYPPALHPADPLMRARHRGWIEVVSTVIAQQYRLMMAEDAASFEEHCATLRAGLARFEPAVVGPLFAGETFCLVDAAMAPVFSRAAVMRRWTGIDFFPADGAVAGWSAALLARPSVAGSLLDDFEARLAAYLRKAETHLASLIPA